MGAGASAIIACQACGKSYAWKPQYAGRKVKCQCGQVMDMPVEPPAAPQDDLYDLAPDQTEQQRQAGAAIPAAAVMAVGADDAAAPARVLSYVSAGHREEEEEGPSTFMDFQFPIILITAGVVMALVNGLFFDEDLGSISAVALQLGLRTIIDLVLICVGLLITARMMDLSLGDPGQAALKVVAIALMPAALAEILGGVFGVMGALLGWFLSLVLTYSLFMVFFEMDFAETMICTCIIWLIRTWVGFFIVGIIVSLVLGRMAENSDVGSAGPGAAPSRSSPRMVAPSSGGDGAMEIEEEEE